ncbi:MAG: inositol monophosphatase family protein [Alphaproteobacteria bacterium]|nr:inositol monophosphatase family protein [Alphaproteobacteria bacterium]
MAALSPIMTVMVRAAEKAGRNLTRDFGEVENLQVSRKGPADFVTAADKRAEEIIFEELKKARPDYSFLMEESGEVKGNDGENRWIIDPLDGTHNFMHGLPHWCVSIALESKGRIEAGVIYDPIKEEVFRAERSGGAFVNGTRMRVSGRNQLESATIGFGSAYLDKAKQAKFMAELNAVSSVAPMVRRFGAAALDLSYVAAGRLDGFWERGLKPWDAAAGVLMVKESGGFVSSIDNEDNVVYSQNLVSGNQSVYSDLRKILKA